MNITFAPGGKFGIGGCGVTEGRHDINRIQLMIRGTMAMVVGRLGPSRELLTCFAGAGKPEPVGQSEARDRKLSLSFPATETVLVLYLGRIGHKIPLNKNKIRRFSFKIQ